MNDRVQTRVEFRPRTADTGGVGLSANSFAAIYAEHMPELTRYCRGILRDREDAEDAAQAAMEKALNALSDGRAAPEKVRPWLFTIAQREAFDVLRRRKRSAAVDLDESVLPAQGSIEEIAVVRERLAALLADLRSLSARQRQVLVERELGGRSYRDIARDLGVSEAAAQQVVLEARRSLMQFEAGRSLECREVQSWMSAHDHARVRTRRVRAHLRACDGCRCFQSGIRGRRRDLAMLLPGIGGSGAWWSSLGAAFGSGGAKAVATAGIVVVASGAALVTGPPLLSGDAGLPAGGSARPAPPADASSLLPALTARIQGGAAPTSGSRADDPRGSSTRPARRSTARARSTASGDAHAATTTGPAGAGGQDADEATRSRKRRPSPSAAPEPAPEPAPGIGLAGGEALRPVDTVVDAAKPVLEAAPDVTPVLDTAGGILDEVSGELPEAGRLRP